MPMTTQIKTGFVVRARRRATNTLYYFGIGNKFGFDPDRVSWFTRLSAARSRADRVHFSPNYTEVTILEIQSIYEVKEVK